MTDSDAAANVDADAYADELARKRAEKDDFFGSHPQSPIPPEHRDEFSGLDYFDPNPDARVSATVTVHDDPEPVTMETTAGNEVRYLRLVTFSFELRGESVELHGYQQEREDDNAIFVPFRDKTTGQQSYRNGRYLELHPEGELADGESVVLDFNLAYTPFCAYSDTFSCPLPPEENWLEVAVAAGERDWTPVNE
ncbi:hypothetical protein C499_01950 [Halogeometricum borinquense DSM 11551]|uniref:DUF1684 domain-containing protein n=2 Tax=Halogeometricum borinquense TaxID=60847 RepID=E4NPC7_HALBP|nr:DUF1684 domain-containing protein [Halogeometricum borinquense]ADQ66482.1 Protein of unknown function (DUF1684) [Halogeometricum borinquense DSM 11551]ELY31200.1 hypothetical protein C499_01950 [Halogeometricum borinquense DSM 11551]